MQPNDGRETGPVRILVVDPDDRTRESLSGLLGIGDRCTVVGSAGRPDSALDRAVELRPDVVVLEPRLPDIDGGSAFIARLRERLPSVRVLVMWRGDERNGEAALDADGFVRKTFRANDLVAAVVAVAFGEPTGSGTDAAGGTER